MFEIDQQITVIYYFFFYICYKSSLLYIYMFFYIYVCLHLIRWRNLQNNNNPKWRRKRKMALMERVTTCWAWTPGVLLLSCLWWCSCCSRCTVHGWHRMLTPARVLCWQATDRTGKYTVFIRGIYRTRSCKTSPYPRVIPFLVSHLLPLLRTCE